MGELLGAEITAVGLLACVDPLMNPQVRRLYEPFVTDVAMKGPLSSVCPLVQGKLRLIKKALFAHPAFRGCLSRDFCSLRKTGGSHGAR